MSDFMVLVFFGLLFLLFFIIYKYFMAISDVARIVDQEKLASCDNEFYKSSKLFLMMNIGFLASLYTRSYADKSRNSEKYISAMDKARILLIFQYPLAIVIFALPVISSIIYD